MSAYLFTSESVSEGHPDKVADQISDAVLDAILAQDKRARVACETMVKTGVAIVAGEITTSAWIDLEALTRKVILDIGYNSSEVGFDGATCGVLNLIGKQSPDINQGVDRKKPEEQGAGDQGLMFGYATNETQRHDAGGDLLLASPRRAAGQGAQEGQAEVAASGCEVAGHAALRKRQGRRDRRRRAVDAARSGRQAEASRRSRARGNPQCPCCRRSGCTRAPSSTSTRPASSSSADRWATAA